LLKLPLAVSRANNFLTLKLLQEKLGRSQTVLLIIGIHLLAVGPLSFLIRALTRRRLKLGVLTLFQAKLTSEEIRRRIGTVYLRKAHPQRRKVCQPGFHSGVIDPLGVQLKIDVLVDAHSLDSFDIPSTRAKRDAVEQVNDFLVPSEARARRLRFRIGDDRHDRAEGKRCCY